MKESNLKRRRESDDETTEQRFSVKPGETAREDRQQNQLKKTSKNSPKRQEPRDSRNRSKDHRERFDLHNPSPKKSRNHSDKSQNPYNHEKRALESLKPQKRCEKREEMEIEDVEMSPVEMLGEEVDFLEHSEQNKYGLVKSKFDSDSEGSESPKSPENPKNPSKIDLSYQDLLDQDSPGSPEQMDPLEVQKSLISKLPLYFPGLMGCRNVEEYHMTSRIDEGTFGVVYKATNKRTDEVVALKRLKMEKEKYGFPITSLREINMLLKAGNNENIIKVNEILVGNTADKIYLVMEYMDMDLKGLLARMVRENRKFSTGEQKNLMRQLLSGIEYIHDLWILHRDLKTANLLISESGILKIADFGLAREFGDPIKKFTSLVVTLYYRAPELLLNTKFYSTPIDNWSAGCIMAELLLQTPLFPGKGEIDQLMRIFMELGTPTEQCWPGVERLDGWKFANFERFHGNGKFKKKMQGGRMLNESGFELVSGLLTLDPNQRLTATEALKHKWFKEEPLPVPLFSHKNQKLDQKLENRPENLKPKGFSLKFDASRF